MRTAGASVCAIARAVQLNRRTVTGWLAAGAFPERRTSTVCRRDTVLAPVAVTVQEQYRSGVQNGAALYRWLHAQGYRGYPMTVRPELGRLRRLDAQEGRAPPAGSMPPTPVASSYVPLAVPSMRQLAWLLCTDDAALPFEHHAYVAQVGARIPVLAVVRRRALAFAQMLKTHDVNPARPWLDAARRSDLVVSARGIERGYVAVLAAIIFLGSNGPVEGHIRRLKAIKCAIYGRAGFALLRRRVLHNVA